jgi:tetratricopeptide (TPR) repeat protein
MKQLPFFLSLNKSKKKFCDIRVSFLNFIFICIFSTIFLSSCRVNNSQSINKSVKLDNTTKYSVEIQNLLLDAQKYLLINNLDKAKEILYFVKNESPKNDVVYYLLSKYYEINNKWDSAYQYIEMAIKLADSNVYYIEQSANLLVNLRKYKEAAQRYETLISKNPNVMEYYFNAAQMYLMAYMPNKSIEIFTKLENQHGFMPEIGFYKYQIYALLNKNDEALDELWRCIQYDPSNLEFKKEYSSFAIEKGKITALYRLVQWAKQRDSSDGYAALFASNYYFSINKTNEMKKELLIALQDPRVDFQDKLQVILSSLNNPNIDDTFMYQLFDILMNLHNDKTETFNIIGIYYQSKNMLDSAINNFKKALYLDSTNDATYRNLILAYESKQMYDSMLFYANKAVDFYPEIGEFFFYGGYAAFMLKDYTQSILLLNNALNYLTSKNKDLINTINELLANAYYQTAQYDKAFDYFEKSIKANPTNATLKNNYAYFLAQQDTLLNKALSLIDEALRLNPNNPSFIDTKAWILYKLNNLEDAKNWIDKALMFNDSDPDILEHAGDIYYKLNKKDMAISYWQKAIDNGKNPDLINEKLNEK